MVTADQDQDQDRRAVKKTRFISCIHQLQGYLSTAVCSRSDTIAFHTCFIQTGITNSSHALQSEEQQPARHSSQIYLSLRWNTIRQPLLSGTWASIQNHPVVPVKVRTCDFSNLGIRHQDISLWANTSHVAAGCSWQFTRSKFTFRHVTSLTTESFHILKLMHIIQSDSIHLHSILVLHNMLSTHVLARLTASHLAQFTCDHFLTSTHWS